MTKLSRRQALAGGGFSALVGAATPAQAAAPGASASRACAPNSATITVEADRVLGAMPNFWRCTGFTPAELLLLPEMRQTLSLLGAIPNRGLEFVRVHYLLDLVAGKRIGARLVYDWGLFDEGLDTILGRGMCPFFE